MPIPHQSERWHTFVSSLKHRGVYLTGKQALQWRWQALRTHIKHRERQGVPPGLSLDMLSRHCFDHHRKSPVHASYIHLSGWKASCAYRVLLRPKSGKDFRVIYKDALYTLQEIPALRMLPIIPGLPEYEVYHRPFEPLKRYLPEVYLCEKVDGQKHYRYLLEDLSREYRGPFHERDIFTILHNLDGFHEDFMTWAQSFSSDHFLQYGVAFSRALQQYIVTNIEPYLAKHRHIALVQDIREHWPHIMTFYAKPEFSHKDRLRPIHGDLNLSNIFLHKTRPERMKFIDWEWAGWGLPHAELACLLKSQPDSVVQKILSIYASHHPEFSLEEHRYMYEWCQLERGLLDTAFFISQFSTARLRNVCGLAGPIKKALRRVLQTYHHLRGGHQYL